MQAADSVDQTCILYLEQQCNYDHSELCTCGPGPNGLLQDLETSVDTAACLRVLQSTQSYYEDYAKTDNICPPNTLGEIAGGSQIDGNTCVARASLSDYDEQEDKTCSHYCAFHKSMRCAAAAYAYSDSCYMSKAALLTDLVTCDTVIDGDALCACELPDDYLELEEAEAATPPSNACINMALGGDDIDYTVGEYCDSAPASTDTPSSCKVTVNAYSNALGERNCDSFCGSFEGMQCAAAAEVSDNWHDRRRCYSGTPIACDATVEVRFMMCTCQFSPDSVRADQLYTGPVLTPNQGMKCPAYQYDADHRQQNENDRDYSKVTLTYEVDPGRQDGALKVVSAKKERDEDHSSRDSYNVNDVEVCDGLESTIEEGDDPLKCSFGHRLRASSPCYGKLEMNFDSATTACAARGGHLLSIETEDEFLEISELYVGQNNLGWGLYKANGFDYEWASNPGVSVDVATELSFLNQDWSHWKYGCTVLNLNSPSMRDNECFNVLNYICEADPSGNPEQGGDLLADEGGFCLWYLEDPDLELPDDESNGFRNTEIAHFLAVSEETSTRKYFYFPEYQEAHDASFRGHEVNRDNWDLLTYEKLGRVGEDGAFLGEEFENYDFHCHMSPTNFGITRIYMQQHMLERLYPGQFKKHCFCGYKHLAHLVSRCDCTLNGVRNNNCRSEHRPLLWEATQRENGEVVRCNNCNNRGF